MGLNGDRDGFRVSNDDLIAGFHMVKLLDPLVHLQGEPVPLWSSQRHVCAL